MQDTAWLATLDDEEHALALRVGSMPPLMATAYVAVQQLRHERLNGRPSKRVRAALSGAGGALAIGGWQVVTIIASRF